MLKSKMTSCIYLSFGRWRAVRGAYFALLFQNIMQLDILVFLFIFHEKRKLNGTAIFRFITTTIQNSTFITSLLAVPLRFLRQS
jgi:hypothetical protein